MSAWIPTGHIWLSLLCTLLLTLTWRKLWEHFMWEAKLPWWKNEIINIPCLSLLLQNDAPHLLGSSDGVAPGSLCEDVCVSFPFPPIVTLEMPFLRYIKNLIFTRITASTPKDHLGKRVALCSSFPFYSLVLHLILRTITLCMCVCVCTWGKTTTECMFL